MSKKQRNRGGRGLFKWEDVRSMPYKDRECYLGSSTSLGYLDKGGRWRKKDWWTKPSDKKTSKQDLAEERKRAKEEDEQRLRAALNSPVRKRSRSRSL